eukprot:scaffold1833_cov185-Ochromonas_danica.AAC.5
MKVEPKKTIQTLKKYCRIAVGISLVGLFANIIGAEQITEYEKNSLSDDPTSPSTNYTQTIYFFFLRLWSSLGNPLLSPPIRSLSIYQAGGPHSNSLIESYGQRVAYLGNHYGLFANMTKWRDEIIIEVSADDKTWHMIAWKYKPDSIFLPPKRVRPDYHMPRLDWLMWFLAFKPSVEYYPKWSIVFLLSLLEENEDVLALLHPLTKTTMQILTTQCKDRERWKLRLSRRRYNYDNKSFRISSFMELWMGHRPEPSLTDYPISSTDDEVIAIPAEKDMFWNVGDSQLLIPPSSLADLYAILETNLSTTTSSSSSNRRQQPPPSVETAQEIIMRTLFRNAKNRAAAAATTRQQQQQELRNDEEKESQQANEISKKTE